MRVHEQEVEPSHYRSLACRLDEHDRCKQGAVVLCACPCHAPIDEVQNAGA
jgi:hypothetical protein